MIKDFKHKGLKQLFEKGSSSKVNPQQKDKCLRILDALETALKPEDMNIPGWDYPGLEGKPKRYSITVTGNWRITFEWDPPDATGVNYEDYH